MPISEAERAYPRRFAQTVEAADNIFEAAGKLRRSLGMIGAKDAANANQIGKAIAFMAVAERAAMDASAMLGRTTKDLWWDETDEA